MATDSELQAWHREWREVFEDMGRRELLCVLRELGIQLGIQNLLTKPEFQAWAQLEDRIFERAKADALKQSDVGDISF